MASVDLPRQPPQLDSQQEMARQSLIGRNNIAGWVVVGSFLTIFLMVGAMLGLAVAGSEVSVTQLAEKTFNIILPVLAGWVGTVLAFYFSAQSLDRTSATLDTAIKAGGSGSASGPGVGDVMLPIGSIRGLIDLDTKKPESIKLSELKAQFDAGPEAGGPITRLVFVNRGVFQHVLHVGTFNGFLVKRATDDPLNLSFADLLADPEMSKKISDLVVFVLPTASLTEAKAALDGVAGAQDIIVTERGTKDSPMRGWLTNVALTRALTVK